MPLLPIWAMLVSAASPAMAQSRARVPVVVGCWQSTRPLGPTGVTLPVEQAHSGNWEWSVFALRDSGRVVLPLLSDRERTRWEARSYWRVVGDSVELTVFTGLQGWKARLAMREQVTAMSGYATYLTDAVVANEAPTRRVVTLRRTACKPAWTSLPITTRLPRSWERGEALYFENQVERPAALAAGVKLPDGVLSMRPLRPDERSDARPDRPEVVVAQFVVESNGRADTSALKLLYANGERGSVAVQNQIAALLAAVRFTPAMVGGQAVNQLAQWRIERSKK